MLTGRGPICSVHELAEIRIRTSSHEPQWDIAILSDVGKTLVHLKGRCGLMSFFTKSFGAIVALVLATAVAAHTTVGSGGGAGGNGGGPANTAAQNATIALLNINNQYANASPNARGQLLAH